MNVSYPNWSMFRGCENRNTERTLRINLIQHPAPDTTCEDGHKHHSEEKCDGTSSGFPKCLPQKTEWTVMQDIRKVSESKFGDH